MSDKVTKQVDLKVSASGAEKVPGLMDKISHSLHEMNNEARKGAFHGFETIFKGAGAGAGIYAAAEGIKKLAEAIESYTSHQKTANEAVHDFLSQLPLFGQVYDATHAVMGLITGMAELEAEIKRLENTEIGRQEGRKTETETYGAIIKKRYAETHPETTTHLAELLKERRALGSQLKDREADNLTVMKSGGWTMLVQTLNEHKADAEILNRASKENWGSILKDLGEAGREFADRFVKATDPFRKTVGFLADQFAKAAEFQEKYRNEFNYQMQQDTLEFERMKEEELDQWEAEHKAIAPPIRSYTAPAVSGRFLTGAGGGGESPEMQTARNTAQTNKKLDENTAAIQDLARAINQNPAQIVYIR